MIVYRIERQRYLEDTLKGIGASLTNGFRWNSLSTRMVYTAESRALAMLEIFVHINGFEDLPNDRFFVEIFIPDDIQILEVLEKDLPHHWNMHPPILVTQKIGDSFVYNTIAPVLKVPSVLVPNEYNYLINPLHPDSQKIKVKEFYILKIDARLYK